MAESCLREAGPARADTAAAGVLVARHAVRSLYQELVLYPKPGLVSLVDTGSHTDMDASTFVRSLFSLRRYFLEIALAGSQGADFAVLRGLGIEAERRMLLATGGINTHRGAIFSLVPLTTFVTPESMNSGAISASITASTRMASPAIPARCVRNSRQNRLNARCRRVHVTLLIHVLASLRARMRHELHCAR